MPILPPTLNQPPKRQQETQNASNLPMSTTTLDRPNSVKPSERLAFGDDSVLLNPELLKAARHIYRTFYEVHPEVMQRPLGVAMGRLTHRGKLVFGDKPVLLPQECFVPFSQIEPDLA